LVVIPGPLQLPFGVAAVRNCDAPFEQKGPEGLIDASGAASTVITSVSVLTQPPTVIVYVTVLLPTAAFAGLKIPPPLTPVPDQVPPGVTDDKLAGAALAQNGLAGMIVASAAAFTIMFSVSVDVHPFNVTLYDTTLIP
jgi:hypothetical protein